jgi:hypothetical protein
MVQKSFAEGYRDGWESVAGTEPTPDDPTFPTDGDPLTYECGFRYGKSDAAERFQPGSAETPAKPI